MVVGIGIDAYLTLGAIAAIGQAAVYLILYCLVQTVGVSYKGSIEKAFKSS